MNAGGPRERPLVLVADDDEDILALVSLQLERANLDVIQARTGDEALALAVARARPRGARRDDARPERLRRGQAPARRTPAPCR